MVELETKKFGEGENLPKIFLVVHRRIGNNDVTGLGLAEDGHVLSNHWSSGEEWLKHDLGFVSNWKHENYKKHYPDGYELVWIGSKITNNQLMIECGFEDAYQKNKKLNQDSKEEKESTTKQQSNE